MAIFGLFTAINSCKGQTDVTVTKTMPEEINLKGKVKTVTYVYGKDIVGDWRIDENRIKIHVGTITIHSGEWHGRTSGKEEPDAEMGVFLIAPTENGFRLIRCAEDVTDQQRLTCSDMVHALPQIRTGSRDLKWIKSDPYMRDTDNLQILHKGLLADGRYLPGKAKLLYSRYIEHGEVIAFLYRAKHP